MRFIPTKIHAGLDYVGGLALIAIPLMWLDEGGPIVWVPVAVGVVMVVQSLFTNYEYSLSNSISVPAHLTLDAIAGLLLAASPWIFGFYETMWLPHLLVGVMEIGAAFTTKLHRDEPATGSMTSAGGI